MNDTFEVLDFIEDNDVQFIRLQFCDLFGQNRNISVTAPEFERALHSGLMFRSSAVPGYEMSEDTELILVPDPKTIKTLPWRPQQGGVARVICEVRKPDGSDFEGDSRNILKRTIELAKEEGINFKVGVKIEFYLFELDEKDQPTLTPVDQAGFFDLAPLDKGENTRREIILTLEEMGFDIKSSHHETGAGQHEIDFRMSDPLTCADNIQTFKSVVKTIAERNGMHASFMPKPLQDEPGSGMHVMISAERDGRSLFTEKDQSLSEDGIHFAGGIYNTIDQITSFSNPLINSYKRLSLTGDVLHNLKWDPASQTTVIRVPDERNNDNRIFIRNPDNAANPYLLFSLLIRSGINGIKNKTSPAKQELTHLPETLKEALDLTEESEFVTEVLGEETKKNYLAKKREEWNDYNHTVHDWEINRYFNQF